MIEIIYKESGEKEDAVLIKPPKNIRQIGMPRGRHKLYVEDYVYTFLHSAAFEGECQKRTTVLLGKSEVSQDIRYTFINGAVSCDDLVFREDGIVFDESCWEYIYKEIKQYFDGREIVGWFLGAPGFPLELTPMVEAAHRKYFAGRDKVLFLSEPAEREDVFFAYEQGVLQRKEGYYIYYEKNPAMQEYMISARERVGDRKPELKEGEVSDTGNRLTENSAEAMRDMGERISAEEAIQNYRSMLLERKQESPSRKMSTFLYIAASAAMVILCVIGITTMNNYEKMKQLQETIAVFADFGGKGADKEQQDSVVVETVPGQVTPENRQPGSTNDPTGDGQQTGSVPGQSAGGQQSDGTGGQQPGSAAGQQDASGGGGQADVASAVAKTYIDQGYYIVQPGDKLELICKNIYQTTSMMDKLCEANKIDDVDKIYAGQKLILP